MSPVVEDPSPSAGQRLTATPIPRHPIHGADVHPRWWERRRRFAFPGRGPDDGQTAAEGDDIAAHFSAAAAAAAAATPPGPWSTTAWRGTPFPRLQASATSQRRHLPPARWHLEHTHSPPDAF